jgi:hypothetical protein
MSYTNTTRLTLKKADIGSNQAFETSVMNANWDKVDAEAVAVDLRLDTIETAVGDGTGLATLTGTQTLTNKTLTAPVITNPVITYAVTTVSGTTYSLLSTDADNFVNTTSSSAVTITVANVLSAGQYVNVIQRGSGQVTFVAGSGVTLNSISSNKKISAQHGGVSIICVASGVYQMVGSLVA